MTDTPMSQDEILERIETMQNELLVVARDIERRIDVFNQEFQRVATVIRRDDIRRTSGGGYAASAVEPLNHVCQRLDRIEALLSQR